MKKRGIAKAVEQEILASYEQLYRLAITYVKNEQDAMDVVQESAYKAMKNAGQVKEETYIKTWLWRIVINTSLDMCKKQKRIVSGVFIPEEAKEDVYKDWDMLAALEELEERERTIVILKYFEEWKIDDIADLLKEIKDKDVQGGNSMNHEKIDRMKQEYEQIEVPEALKTQVEAGIRKGKRETQKGSIRFLKGAATVAAAMVALVISVNVSPTIAHAMEEVPLLGTIVKVVNFSTYSDVQDDKNMEANVDIPQVAVTNQDGEVLSDETDELNQEVKKYAGGIIKSYQSDVASIEDGENGNEAVNSSYQVVTDNDRLFALRIDTSIVMGGSNQYTKIYNVDKKTGNTITLNDLFQKDSDYLDRISEEIEKQMKENMEKDSNLQYFLDKDVDGYSFDGIKNDVNFYVNKEGELTIVFDKYEVAPGYMGIVEFTIPTSVVSDIIKDGYLQ